MTTAAVAVASTPAALQPQRPLRGAAVGDSDTFNTELTQPVACGVLEQQGSPALPASDQPAQRVWSGSGPAHVSPALLVLTQPCLCQPSLLAAAQRSQPSPVPLSWNAPNPAARRAPSWTLVPVVAQDVIDAAHNTLGTGAMRSAALGGGETVLRDD